MKFLVDSLKNSYILNKNNIIKNKIGPKTMYMDYKFNNNGLNEVQRLIIKKARIKIESSGRISQLPGSWFIGTNKKYTSRPVIMPGTNILKLGNIKMTGRQLDNNFK